jgi:hypothetical protein
MVKMSRNKNVDYTQYVHEFTDAAGSTRYAVGEWSAKNAQYTRPLDKRERELTGCFAEFSHTAAGLGGYRNRAQALRRARYLYRSDVTPE